MAESVSGQDEVNPAVFWLAPWAEWAYGPILPARDFPRWSRNKKQDAWILASVSSKHNKKLGKYPLILVNNG